MKRAIIVLFCKKVHHLLKGKKPRNEIYSKFGKQQRWKKIENIIEEQKHTTAIDDIDRKKPTQTTLLHIAAKLAKGRILFISTGVHNLQAKSKNKTE
jgi:hypothetical protein